MRRGLPARLAGRIHQASGGNPRLALALGHSLAEAAGSREGGAHHADPLPVSGQAREVARRLLGVVPAQARRTLLFAALAARPTTALLRRAGRPDAEAELAVAERAALLTVEEDGTIRFIAGALPTALAADAGWPERAAGHAALAAAVDDPVQAVRHRALAVDAPDEVLAAEITEAAASCRRRGQRAQAAELGLLAADRTPGHLPAEELARLVGAAEDAGWAAAPTWPAAPPAPCSPATPRPRTGCGRASPSSTRRGRPWAPSTRPSRTPWPTPRETPPCRPPSG